VTPEAELWSEENALAGTKAVEYSDLKSMHWWTLNVINNESQTGDLLDPMARATRMVEGHLEGILAQLTRGLMTAFMECLNSLFSAAKRKARGYQTVEYMSSMLYFVTGNLTLPCC